MAARAGGHGEPPRFPVATPTGTRGGHRLSVPASGESAVSTAGLRAARLWAAGQRATRFPARNAAGVGAYRAAWVDQRDAAGRARAATACGRLARPHRIASPRCAATTARTASWPTPRPPAWDASRPTPWVASWVAFRLAASTSRPATRLAAADASTPGPTPGLAGAAACASERGPDTPGTRTGRRACAHRRGIRITSRGSPSHAGGSDRVPEGVAYQHPRSGQAPAGP